MLNTPRLPFLSTGQQWVKPEDDNKIEQKLKIDTLGFLEPDSGATLPDHDAVLQLMLALRGEAPAPRRRSLTDSHTAETRK